MEISRTRKVSEKKLLKFQGPIYRQELRGQRAQDSKSRVTITPCHLLPLVHLGYSCYVGEWYKNNEGEGEAE